MMCDASHKIGKSSYLSPRHNINENTYLWFGLHMKRSVCRCKLNEDENHILAAIIINNTLNSFEYTAKQIVGKIIAIINLLMQKLLLLFLLHELCAHKQTNKQVKTFMKISKNGIFHAL